MQWFNAYKSALFFKYSRACREVWLWGCFYVYVSFQLYVSVWCSRIWRCPREDWCQSTSSYYQLATMQPLPKLLRCVYTYIRKRSYEVLFRSLFGQISLRKVRCHALQAQGQIYPCECVVVWMFPAFLVRKISRAVCVRVFVSLGVLRVCPCLCVWLCVCTACVHLFHAKTSAMQCVILLCSQVCVYMCVCVCMCGCVLYIYVHEWECPCVTVCVTYNPLLL